MPNFTPRTNATVDAGMMRRRLTIQQSTNTADGNAGLTQTWNDLLTVFGALTSWKASEITVGAQIQPVVWAKFLIRYQPGTRVTAGMRVVDNDPNGSANTTYTIFSALDPDGTQRQLELTCQQIIAGT